MVLSLTLDLRVQREGSHLSTFMTTGAPGSVQILVPRKHVFQAFCLLGELAVVRLLAHRGTVCYEIRFPSGTPEVFLCFFFWSHEACPIVTVQPQSV